MTFTAVEKAPALETIVPQQQGPLKIMVNPGAFPSGGRTYDGTGFVNSAILYPQGSPPNCPKASARRP